MTFNRNNKTFIIIGKNDIAKFHARELNNLSYRLLFYSKSFRKNFNSLKDIKDSKFNLNAFAKLISKLSKTQVILIKNYNELKIFFKKNLINNEIIIGMGAGLISKYMRELKTEL